MGEDEGQRYEGKAQIQIDLVARKPHPEHRNNTGQQEENSAENWRRKHSRRQLWFNGLLVAFTAVYAVTTFFLLRETKKATQIAKDNAALLDATERAKLVVGRKDGVIAQLEKATDGASGVVFLFLHNTGRLTATDVDVVPLQISTESFDPKRAATHFPVQKAGDRRSRSRNKRTGAVTETGMGTIIGGESTARILAAIIPPAALKQAAQPGTFLTLLESVEYCDSSGRYSCATFILSHRNLPEEGFDLAGKLPCIPPTPLPDSSPMAPCPKPGEWWP